MYLTSYPLSYMVIIMSKYNMDTRYNIEIEERILDYLDGWNVTEPRKRHEDDLMLQDNKIINSDDIRKHFDKACLKICTYLYIEYIPYDDRIIEEICQYTAGLLFKKYNLTPNDNYEDNTPNTGFGNYLINNALKNLEPFRNSKISMWSLR